jgi:hypothetical protein
MPGLVPGIHALLCGGKGVDGRDKPGHDNGWAIDHIARALNCGPTIDQICDQ